MKRILIAGLRQETGSFNPKPTVYDDFDVLTGQKMIDKTSGGYVGGALKVKENYHIESLANSVLQFEHAVIGDPGASVVEYYVGGADCAGDCALPGTPACSTCSATPALVPWNSRNSIVFSGKLRSEKALTARTDSSSKNSILAIGIPDCIVRITASTAPSMLSNGHTAAIIDSGIP